MTTTATTQTRHSVCDQCAGPITITIVVGEQRWHEVDWEHTEPTPTTRHRAVPELRFAIDATCPGCNYPEVGYAPAREEFVCSRCEWTGKDRPTDAADTVLCDECGTHTTDPQTCPHGREHCPECRENGYACNTCRAETDPRWNR